MDDTTNAEVTGAETPDALNQAQATFDAAEAAVIAAEEHKAALKAAAPLPKTGDGSLAQAKKNLKASEAHYKAQAATEGVTPEQLTEAENGVEGWKAEVVRIEGLAQVAKDDMKAATEAVKVTKAARTEARKALTAAKKTAPKPKVERITQNGKMHPLPGSKCGEAWAVFDELTTATGKVAQLGAAVILAESRDLNVGNVRCEFNNWRKFHGHANPGRAKIDELATLAETYPDVNGFKDAADKLSAAKEEAEAKAAAKEQAKAEKAAAKAKADADKAAAKAKADAAKAAETVNA